MKQTVRYSYFVKTKVSCTLRRYGIGPDVTRDHMLSSRILNGCGWRHAAGNFQAFRSVGSASALEPSGLFSENNGRPDGVADASWMLGGRLAWDATCVHSTSASNLAPASASATASAAARSAETYKKVEYRYANISPDCVFVSVATETFGHLVLCAIRFFVGSVNFWLATRAIVARRSTLGATSASPRSAAMPLSLVLLHLRGLSAAGCPSFCFLTKT